MSFLLFFSVALGFDITINPSLTLSVSEVGQRTQYILTRHFTNGEGWFALGFPNQQHVGMDETRAFICTDDGIKVYDIEAKTTMQSTWINMTPAGSCTIFDNHAVMIFEADSVPLEGYTFVWAMNPSGEWNPEAGFESCWHGPENKGEFTVRSESEPSSITLPEQPIEVTHHEVLDQDATINALKNIVAETNRHMMLQQVQSEHDVRSRGSSGVTRVRAYSDGTHNYAADGGIGNGGILASHDHPNFRGKIGLGEFGAVLNGIRFDTRHNDYKVKMSAMNANVEYNALEDIPYPDVPPSVLEQPTIEAQIHEMQQYFKAFKAQDKTVRDYTDFFKPVLCYLEGAWIKDTDSMEEFFDSDRHSLHADTWKEQFDAQVFRGNSGKKHVGENVPFLPTKIVDVKVDSLNGISYPVYANFEYRIACQPIEGEVPTDRFIIDNDENSVQKYARGRKSIEEADLLETRMGHFKVNGLSPENWNFNAERGREQTPPAGGMRRNFLDELMEQVPGKDGPSANLKDDSFDVPTSTYDEGDIELNTGFYSRFFSYGYADAMGRHQQMRGYSDLSLWAAMTTHEKVAGYRICQTEDESKTNSEDHCWEQKWTYAIPLEIIYLSPLENWNPYELPKFDSWRIFLEENDGRDGSADSPYQGHSDSRYFVKVPQEFYASGGGASHLADTDPTYYVETSAAGVKPVMSSGTKILSDPIGDDVGIVRLRWPIFPIHDRSSLAFREVTALGEKIRNEYEARDNALQNKIDSLESVILDLVALISSSASGSSLASSLSQLSLGGYTLVRENVECGSGDQWLGRFETVQGCADKVREEGGSFFIYGKGRKAGKCYMEHTSSESCPEGFDNDLYDFYKIADDDGDSAADQSSSETAAAVGKWTEATYPVAVLRSGAGIPESHTHDIFCDWNCFVMLYNGEEVTITSEDWDGHTHDFTFKLGEDRVSMTFVDCDSCGGSNPNEPLDPHNSININNSFREIFLG